MTGLAQLPMYMRSNKKPEARLQIHHALTPVIHALSCMLSTTLSLTACKQVKLMEPLPKMSRVGLALLDRSPRLTR